MEFGELSFVNFCNTRAEINLKLSDIQMTVNSWLLLLHEAVEANGDA